MLRNLIIARLNELNGNQENYSDYADRDLLDELEEAIRMYIVKEYGLEDTE
jgi:hypothetical protein